MIITKIHAETKNLFNNFIRLSLMDIITSSPVYYTETYYKCVHVQVGLAKQAIISLASAGFW